MVFDAIELRDPDYGTVKKSSKIRKIKFKSISFKNISNLWKNFRINLLNKRLENAKEKLVSMELNTSDFDNKTARGNMNVAEKKILRKTTAVAKLESRIKFLRTGHETTDDFISSRAIKLKDNMMKNMRYNCNSAYSVLPEAQEEERFNAIFGPEKEMEEATKRIGEEVRRIMDEDAAKKEAVTEPEKEVETQPVVAPTITAPSTEEIREAVNEAFAAHEKSVVTEPVEETDEKENNEVTSEQVNEEVKISEESVQETVEDAMSQIDVVPNVTEEEVTDTIEDALNQIDVVPAITEEDVTTAVEDALNQINVTPETEPELENIRVSSNESTTAKVNKFINDDGTYRMKREDIDEDFRITRYNSEEQPKTMQNIIKERILVEQLRQIQEKMNTTSKTVVPKEVVPVKEDPQNERDMPVVVPERKMTPVEQVKELSAAVDEVQTMDDIQAIMASVSELKTLTEQAKQEEAAAAQTREILQQERTAAVQELLDYQALLKAGLAESKSRVAAEQQAASTLESEIQSIRNITGRR